MLITLIIYFGIGLAVVGYVALRQDQPREKEIGNWMVLTTVDSPLFFLGAIVLWPLWLLFLCFPQESFVEKKRAPAKPPIDYVGKFAEVVIPLTPTGRISIEGIYRDARAESGSIAEGCQVVICARSVGDELIVKEAIRATEAKPNEGRPPRLSIKR